MIVKTIKTVVLGQNGIQIDLNYVNGKFINFGAVVVAVDHSRYTLAAISELAKKAVDYIDSREQLDE